MKLAALVLVGASTRCQLIGDIGDRSLASGGSPNGGSGGVAGSSGSASVGGTSGANGDASVGGTSGSGGSGGLAAHVQSRLFSAENLDVLHDLSVDRANNDVMLVGTFKATLAFGSGTPPLQADVVEGDLFVARLDTSFNARWSRQIAAKSPTSDGMVVVAGPQGRSVVALTVAGDVNFGSGYAFTGANATDILLAFYSEDGTVEWAAHWGEAPTSERLSDVAVRDTEIALAGETGGGTIDFGGTTSPITGTTAWLAGLDQAGAGKWTRDFLGCPELKIRGLAWVPNGDLVFAGSFAGLCDLGDGWVLGSDSGTATDCLVARLGQSGITWAMANGAGFCVTADVVVGPDDEAVVAGSFDGPMPLVTQQAPTSPDVFVLAWNAAGGKKWGKSLDLNGVDVADSVDVNPDGDAIVSGTFHSDFLLGKLSGLDGGLLWSIDFSTENAFAAASKVAFNGSNEIVVAGTLAQPLDLGGGLLEPDQADLFVVKYAP